MSFLAQRYLVAKVLEPFRAGHPKAGIQDWGFTTLARRDLTKEWLRWMAGTVHAGLHAQVASHHARNTSIGDQEAWKLVAAHASLAFPDG